MQNNTLSRSELDTYGKVLNIHYGDVLIKYGSVLDASDQTIPYIVPGNESPNYVHLQDGDVVIADTAEDETVGKTTEIYNVLGSKIEAGLHTIPCRPMIPFAPKYLGYYMNTSCYHKQLIPLMQGIKVLSVSKGNISKTEISAPNTLEEQKKISSLLYLLDQRAAIQSKIIEALKKYKRGLLNQVFSSKQSFWTKKRIGDFCSITMGQSPDSNSYNLDCIGVPLVQGNADITDGVTTPLRYTSQPTKVCKEGSILLSVRAPVGTVCIADREVCLGRGVCAINSENNAFVRQLFLYLEPSWKTIEQGGTFTAISRNDIENVEVIIPNDASEQKWIGEYLEQIDLRISQEARMLQSILSIRLGLMQQLFI